jgi:hypothetical protein
VSFQYGGIEGEPTFPMTNFATPAAERTGREMCGQGTFGNAQTHCVQLPNTFLFARGAQRLTTTRDDYVQFAEKLIPGLGETIVAGWEALNTPDSATKWDAITKLDALAERNDIAAGELAGLLFNDPQRFVADLAKMLRLNATFIDFRDAAASGQSGKALAAKMAPFVEAVAVWQGTHNYKNNWTWPELQNVLMQIDADAYAPVYALLQYKGMGATPFEQVQDGYRKVELFTPTLIETMKSTVKKLSS